MPFLTTLLLSCVCFHLSVISASTIPSELKVLYFKERPTPNTANCPQGLTDAFLLQQTAGLLKQSGTKVIPFRDPVANKTVTIKSVAANLTQQEETPLEVSILSHFNFQGITPNVVCKFNAKSKQHVVMDMIPGVVTLENTASFFDPRTHNLFQRWADVSIRLTELVEKVHDHRVVHMNLQLDNFLMTPQGRLYIVGFSKARKFNYLSSVPSQAKNIPELQNIAQRYTFKSDIYLLGKVLGELYIRMRMLLIETILKNDDPFLKEFHDLIMKAFPADIIEKLVAKDPSQRPTPQELIQSLQKYREAHTEIPQLDFALTKERKKDWKKVNSYFSKSLNGVTTYFGSKNKSFE